MCNLVGTRRRDDIDAPFQLLPQYLCGYKAYPSPNVSYHLNTFVLIKTNTTTASKRSIVWIWYVLDKYHAKQNKVTSLRIQWYSVGNEYFI